MRENHAFLQEGGTKTKPELGHCTDTASKCRLQGLNKTILLACHGMKECLRLLAASGLQYEEL